MNLLLQSLYSSSSSFELTSNDVFFFIYDDNFLEKKESIDTVLFHNEYVNAIEEIKGGRIITREVIDDNGEKKDVIA